MLLLLTTKEWLTGLRTYTLPAALLIMILLMGIAFARTHHQAAQTMRARQTANLHFRQQWEQLQTVDPHSAAHFGTYIFKPVSLLSSFDKGMEHFTGSSLRIEAHLQHSMATPALRVADTYLRFGALTPANVLLLFLPLLIIFACYNSYLQEKSTGTLKLLLIQGSTQTRIIRSKVKYQLTAINGVLLGSILMYLPLLLMSDLYTTTLSTYMRLLLLILIYSIYVSIFVLLAVAVSAFARNARQSLLLLTGLWLCWNIMVPRLGAGIAAEQYPLPSRHWLQEKIEKAIKTGIDGHTPREQRQQQVIDATLRQYHAESIEQLPVNLNAILMQASEDYTQMVYDTYAAKTDSIILAQNTFNTYLAFIDPYMAVHSISMDLCGTGYLQQQHFYKAASAYRNDFIRRLNHLLATTSQQEDAYQVAATTAFYRTMPAFQYTPPELGFVLQHQWPMIAALLAWLIISICLLQIITHNASVE